MWRLGSGLCNRNVSFHCEISEMLIEWKAPMVSEYKGGNLKATVLYAPSTQTCICLKLEMKFFSPVWPAVRTYLEKTVTENAPFQKLTPFTGFSFTC